jgi:cytochrome P450
MHPSLQGPCVRIGPWEVHIDGRVDPAFWDVLYSSSIKLDKDSWYYDGFGAGLSAVSTGPSDLHRTRRGAMSTYFSTANVRSYEPMVLNQVGKLCSRLEGFEVSKQPVNLGHAYRCLATDVVTSFAIPIPRMMLDMEDFGKHFNALITNFARLITYQRHLKIVFPLLTSVPDWLTVKMDTDGSGKQMVDFQRSYEHGAKLAMSRSGKPPQGQNPSILDAIVSSSELKQQDRSFGRVVEEARNTVGAGTETTGAALTTLSFYLLSQPNVLSKLKSELQGVSRDVSQLLQLREVEKLPYLQACINEALRICCPVTGRLPRVNPRAATTYTSPSGTTYVFPPGIVMSMSMPDLHFNADVFPEPHTFKPERWLESSGDALSNMQQYFVPFGRGSRMCIGQELARMELTLTAGNLFRRFDMELYETTERDVSWAHDFFAPAIPFDSEGLRVKIKDTASA